MRHFHRLPFFWCSMLMLILSRSAIEKFFSRLYLLSLNYSLLLLPLSTQLPTKTYYKEFRFSFLHALFISDHHRHSLCILWLLWTWWRSWNPIMLIHNFLQLTWVCKMLYYGSVVYLYLWLWLSQKNLISYQTHHHRLPQPCYLSK